jgi:hypothetical protein
MSAMVGSLVLFLGGDNLVLRSHTSPPYHADVYGYLEAIH